MKYRFFIHMNSGELLEWTNLTERQAKSMYSITSRYLDGSNFNSFGWEEMK